MELWQLSICIGVVLMCVALPHTRCDLSQNIVDEIRSNQENVSKIIDHIRNNDGKHKTFDRLALLGDKFGQRPSGSKSLEDAIDYVLKEMQEVDEFANVAGETVTVPKWVRGNESASMLTPFHKPLYIMGLGTSIGTPSQGITADVIVVTSFADLETNKDKVPGKIVVYNQPWVNYSVSVAYRRSGAARAAKHGAVAALVRSITQLSVYSPHTGVQSYENGTAKIPVACITVEDAEMLYRLQNRGENITVRLYMEAMNYPDVTSRNVVGEIVGTKYPEQTVIFGGHIDTWDVGTGSMDDGGGLMIAWQALSAIKKLGLRPKRTIRAVLWTSEEMGLIGGIAYYKQHKADVGNVSLIMESDHGAFKPRGLHFTGSGLAKAMMQEVLKMLTSLNTTEVMDDGASSDTEDWVNVGVPGVELYSHNEDYFYYHHTEGDTMSVLNADDLDLCTILWAVTAYVVANLEEILPRTGEYPVSMATVTSSHWVTMTTLAIVAYCIIVRRCR